MGKQKGIMAQLFRLTEKFKSLESVAEQLLPMVDRKSLPHLSIEELNDLPEDDRVYISRWLTNRQQPTGINSYTPIESCNDVTSEVRYMLGRAYIEYRKNKQRDLNGTLLPKADRINIVEIDVIFFERDSGIDVIICTPDNHINKVKALISDDNISKKNANKTITSDEFYWLYYRYSIDSKVLNDDITLINITSFTGNIFDEHHTISGTSDSTTDLIVTKSFVCSGSNPFTNMKISIAIGFIVIDFLVNRKSDIRVDVESGIPPELMEVSKKIALPLYLLSYLLPKLRELYENDAFTDDLKIKVDFSKMLGLEVINAIMSHNNISVEELLLCDSSMVSAE
ncbi:hypothetical protein HCA68_01155 [Listeria booriae]|uniref:hypothetical protein n=1 Tax=Listeria booriae TaxID=1552123 RepID=UPI001629FE06|nr:hypothetical protein [Listeria booriae]MBC1273906.1 hypothetical protein [Listeria booriae]MBC1896266.1 hypothetical protein [Listeria booriae]